MKRIEIISSSVRKGRQSHRVALFFKKYLEQNRLASAEILDLDSYRFPIFEERLRLQEAPPDNAIEFAARVKESDGIIIVTPEYNGGYPASIKNVIDLLYDEWHRKPVAISTVSDGNYGGSQVIMSLQFTLWKMRAWTVPARFPVPNVDENFDEQGNITGRPSVEKRAKSFIDELIWCIEAGKLMVKPDNKE